MLASVCVGSHFQLIRGVQVFNMTGLPTNMAEATCFFFLLLFFFFCSFLFGTGFLGSKMVTLLSLSVWNWVMGERNLGSRQTSKELLEFDLSRISTVFMFALVCL
ncbi:uncharacterized protein APUU_80118A [Aspergillus puulaauensis]|uniref:Uncharacterized protein n=1 Tax=Aspergillus puulaauensis TaxID=1220207 RepID=A0A7R8AUF0_9EURO|nr:uncharacterized protein APUU_80118A [Aspergillus puulaauensis]BCS29815.1 hypothetical protein APUU_80118A [Aspergillus puulaauensis]